MNESLLDIRGLSVAVDRKPLLQGITLTIERNETVILFGPNGSGKSTLLKAILGLSGYTITAGEIVFKGRTLNELPTDERVRAGIGVMYQHPPAVSGVTLRQIARFLSKDEQRIETLAAELSLKGFLDRGINVNFSGGEVKRAELFQVLLQNPDLVLFDEPESGVDLENIALMGKAMNGFLKQDGKSSLIITHTGYILDYIESHRGCVMLGGNFWCLTEPRQIIKDIRESGYEKCVGCHDRKTDR
jgi:Fe-S cluster assembly ATP-binding protein